MSIGAGAILRASLILGLTLGVATASAQTPSNGGWTDPPARSAAPIVPPAAAIPVAPAKEPTTEPAPVARDGTSRENPVASANKPTGAVPSVARHPVPTARRPVREARRPSIAVEAPHARAVVARSVSRREAVRQPTRRVVARTFASRAVAAPPYPYAPLPVGRVAGPVDGERNPIFDEGGDRMRRIAAAQAAGYLVVRARSLRDPDGRTVRSYRSFDDDGLD